METDVEIGELELSYNTRGVPTYSLELCHHGLRKHRVVKGNDSMIVERKAQLQIAEWNQKWEAICKRQTKKKDAAQRTEEATEHLESVKNILSQTLTVNDAIDWDNLKDRPTFPEPRPTRIPTPVAPPPVSLPIEPVLSSPNYRPQLSFLDIFFPSRRARKVAEANQRFARAHASWLSKVKAAKRKTRHQLKEYRAALDKLDREYNRVLQRWELRKEKFLEGQRNANQAIEQKKALYESKDPDAVLDYCDMVLSNSRYPDWMPQEWELDYTPETATLIVEYALPSLDSLPTLSEVRYVQAGDKLTEVHISDAQKRQLYDSLVYQITLRSIHELFEADVVCALDAVVFNGRVTAVDPTTGHETAACIVSVHTDRKQFMAINLAGIDPKACFKSLKGVGSSKLHSLTPVAPIIQLCREDSRFVTAREVANTLDDSVNLAAMDWADFEHLVRELFEQEFAAGGGEVKVTQASRDGGVDAIAFDPDPIRGGKIVIQAKRFVNTVGVAAVRDLYGTIMNEGANKGILVTTSDYGPDAHNFAKGKPITLLNGAHLLHLLEKHGRRAKIDIAEARRALR